MTRNKQSVRRYSNDSVSARWDPATARAFYLAAERADRTDLLEVWKRVEPALADVPSVAALPEAIARCAHVRRDALLIALIRLAQAGDETAAVTLMWTMAPWLRSTAQRLFYSNTRDGLGSVGRIRESLQGRLYEVVATFPTTRAPSGLLPRLQLDTLRQTTRHDLDAHRQAATVSLDGYRDSYLDVGFSSGPRDLFPALAGTSELDGSSDEWRHDADRPLTPGLIPERDTEVREMLAWAVGEDVISSQDAELLFDVYLADPNRSGVAGAAERRHISKTCVRQRCSRATRALAQAVSNDGVVPAA